MVEVVPDLFSASYRHGKEVYKEMAEHSFDNEPMLVIVPESDPMMAPPAVVVVPASVDLDAIHIVAAQRVIDPVALGEDKIFLDLSAPPATLDLTGSKAAVQQPKERRFFSTPLP
jgi:hypothetical protein